MADEQSKSLKEQFWDPVAGFGVTFRTMFRNVVTEQYPKEKFPTAPRFHVTGRLDGERFRVHCDADTLPDELLAKVSGGTAFTAQCTDADSEKMVQVWSIEGTTGDWHASGATHGAWLLTPWTPPRA